MIVTTGYEFAVEQFTQERVDEVIPITIKHWIEVGRKDIRFLPNFPEYIAGEREGIIRFFTVRRAGVLVGYSVFIVRHHQHYSTEMFAVQDVMFLDKTAREGMVGYKFVKFCNDELERAGVDVIVVGVNLKRDYGVLLERIGYEPTGVLFERRVNK